MGSWSDWDVSDVILSTDTYVSPPSSLKSYGGHAFLKESVVNDDLSEGQAVFWIKLASALSWIKFAFRHQGDLASSDEFVVSFEVHYDGTWIVIRKQDIVIKDIHYSFDYDSWQKFRVTWWVSESHLIIRVEHYKDGQWVKKIEYSTENTWSNGGRVGFRLYSGSGPVYVDDFSLYVA